MEAPKRLNYPYLITRYKCPSRANLEVFIFSLSDGCPATATCLALTQALRSRRVSSASKLLGDSNQGGHPPLPAVESAWVAAPPRRVFGLGFVAQPSNPVARCSLRQSPLITRLPRRPSLILVLRHNQETVHDFVPLFLPPCGPHLTPLATGSLEQRLIVYSTPGGLIGNDLSRLFFTCTNTSQAATCICNT
jgi:hypothetical protein